MAEDQAMTTDLGHEGDARDSDSGIGTGSSQSTPSQSVSSTPSQSEMNTPILSPEAAPGTQESFTFPPEAFSGLQIQSVREGQETRPSPMDEGFHEQTSHEQHPATAPGNTSACPPAATTTAVPQMDSRGFYIPPESTTRSSPAARDTPANRSTATATAPRQTTRHASYIPPEPHGPKTIQIFVTNFNGKSERFEIRANASVKDLQKLIHDKVGVPPSQQRLVYQGREFQDGNSLQFYGVKDMSTINLLGRLRGGR